MNKLFNTNYEKSFENIRVVKKQPFDYRDLIVHFETPNDLQKFNSIIGCTITKAVQELFYDGTKKSQNSLFIQPNKDINYTPKTMTNSTL